MRRRLVLAMVGLGLSLAGCRTPLAALRQRQDVLTPAGRFEIAFAGGNERDRAQVEQALRAAGPKLARWGGLREGVRVHLLPSHELLEEAVGRRGYAWLRAWARYDEVFLQAPSTWSSFGATPRELEELLTHELTHCVMYQQSAIRTSWTGKGIPLWFREGLASVTADQGYRWPSLEDLARYYLANPNADPVATPDQLYQGQSDLVYGAAHHATVFLLKRHGEEKARTLMRRMAQGANFNEAFEEVIGMAPTAFVAEFGRYVKLRGFRGGRLRPMPLPLPLRADPAPP